MRIQPNPCPGALPLGVLLVLGWWGGPARAQVSEVVVGITPTCPYGLEACWGGAYEALGRLEGVASVEKTPNAYNCTARIYLKGGQWPDPDKWAAQFKAMVDQAYRFRGVEVSVVGTVEGTADHPVLKVPGLDQPVVLRPFQHKLQWNFKKRTARQAEPDEQEAYQELAPKKEGQAPGGRIQVTGPLVKSNQGYILEVREFTALDRDSNPPPQQGGPHHG